MREIYALDVETAPIDRRWAASSALEPWRSWRRTAHITDVSLCRPNGSVLALNRGELGDGHFEECVKSALEECRGKVVYCHNSVFDVAWCLGAFKEGRTARMPQFMRDVTWCDSMLLAKWIVNGQRADDMRFSLSLLNLVKSFLPDHPLTEDFVRIKGQGEQAGQNPEYWRERNKMDVILTRVLAEFLEDKLPAPQRLGYATEMRNILPVANSWMIGLRIDQDRIDVVEREFLTEQEEIIGRLRVNPSVLTSPKQLGHMLFREMGLSPESMTPTGSPSTAADDLKMIGFRLEQAGDSDRARFMKDVCRYKQIATLLSKYVKGTRSALIHTDDGYTYGAPRIFGTYTGRYTYSSKTLDTYQTGLALHQIPRKDKKVRSFIVPPEGYDVYEADASGQESRLMAIRSGDQTMIKIFRDELNFHSMTGSNIVGREYDEFMRAYDGGDLRTNEERQMGKLCNLSCNYRIGGKALAKKAFDDYDIPMSIDKGVYLVNGWIRAYPGVSEYWDNAVREARRDGYAQTFGGRRYKIHDWSSKRAWESESAAINTPIQGSGASMKNLAVNAIYEACADCHFALDLHDASFVWVPSEGARAHANELDEALHNIDYRKYWGFQPQIPLPYESKLGKSFADVK